MSNGLQNCLTGFCCPPPAQVEALAVELRRQRTEWTTERLKASGYADVEHAQAAWFFAHFDAAPKGLMADIYRAVAPIIEQDFAGRKAGG